MSTKLFSNSRGIIGFVYSLLGLTLLVVLAIVLNTLFDSFRSKTAGQGLEATPQEITPTLPPSLLTQPATPQSSQTDLMTSWNTYNNATYAQYSFKYPADWSVREYLNNFGTLEGAPSYVIQQGLEIKGTYGQIPALMYIDVWSNALNHTLWEWLEEDQPPLSYNNYAPGTYKGVSIPPAYNFEVDGTPAIRVEIPEGPHSEAEVLIFFLKGDKIYRVRYFLPDGGLEDTYRRVLTTLKVQNGSKVSQ